MNGAYRAWWGIKARGPVCRRWRIFENFKKDIWGLKPKKGRFGLLRRDKTKSFSPSNCYWAAPKQLQQQRSDLMWIKYKGRRMVAADWARFLGLTKQGLSLRIKRHGARAAIEMGGPRPGPRPRNRSPR